MLKPIFILFNTIILFVMGLMSGDNVVKIINNFPAKVNSGQDMQVEIKIEKPGIEGFGSFELELPEGLTLLEKQDLGAEFLFESNTAKWNWNTLPTGDELILKLTINVATNLQGNVPVKAKFSYILNNEKAFIDMRTAEIEVVNPEMAKAFEATPKESVTAPTTISLPTSNAEPPGNITLNRTVAQGSKPSDLIVTIKIKKGITKGFARFSDDILDGITAKVLKSDGSSFSVADGKLKFVWVAVPEKEDLEISYMLSSTTEKTVALHGEYSYLEDNQSKKINMNLLNAEFGDTEKPVEVAKTEPKKPATKTKPAKTEEKPVAENSKKENPPTSESTSAPIKREGAVNYHIQIGAFKNSNVSANKLKAKFHLTENVNSEFHQSLSKFMIGSHKEYKSAKEHREQTRNNNGVKNAFVVAYNDGKRITVQEALMITNQKWFK